MQGSDTSSGWNTPGKITPPQLRASSETPLTGGAEAPADGVAVAPLEEFEIIRLLGKGGMGKVYLAYEPLMHRNVALKVLTGSTNPSELQSQVARFLAEAMLTGRLTHGGIIPIYQVGFDPSHGYYYSMRYVKGRTLQSMLKARAREESKSDRTYALPRMLEIFVRVCEAMSHAHRNGILHRDLKPSNVMITESNEVLVVDWGLARDLRSHDPLDEIARQQTAEALIERCRQRHDTVTREFLVRGRDLTRDESTPDPAGQLDSDGLQLPFDELTQSGILVGTPWYMSPEQISGERELKPTSDVYALGVILYRLLSGAMPVESRNLTELVSRVSQGEIERIETRPEALRLPKALCDIVNRSLLLEPEERYADAGLLADDIRLYLEGQTPLRLLTGADFREHSQRDPALLKTHWHWEGHDPSNAGDGVELSEGTFIRSQHRSLGDFHCTIGFRARRNPWSLGILVGETSEDEETGYQAHHEVRLGVVGRSFAELIWMGRRMQRRFDVRLQAGQYYRLGIEVEDGHIRVRLDDSLVLNYKDIFPQTGGVLALSCHTGDILVQDFEWHSRGAPLNLSYQFLPDRYFLSGKFEEARQLYNQMAESHPDREEGLMALYKSGLCSAQLKQTQEAFEAFSRLENTMLDHYCILGLARIGILDGNLDWAWEALKSGYLRHKDADVRTEIWFALLDVVEHFKEDEYKERAKRYLELMKELEPTPQELGQTTYEYLDLIMRKAGPDPLRRESARLLHEHPNEPNVAGEALYSLWRTGLDEAAAAIAYNAIEKLSEGVSPYDSRMARLLLLKAELEIAQLHMGDAIKSLREAVDVSEEGNRSERLWAMNWLLMCQYLNGEYEATLKEGRKTLALMDQYSTDQLAYLLFVVALVLLRLEKKDKAMDALKRATECSGWWGKVGGCVLGGLDPEALVDAQPNPNLASEGLLMAGEVLLRMGEKQRATSFLLACEKHPQQRVMTRRLALARLRELGLTTTVDTPNTDTSEEV